MTTYAFDHRSAVELTAQARAAADLAATQYRLGRFLPSRDNYSLTYNFDVNQIGLVDKAEYRAFDTETLYGRTQGGSSRAGKLPPIGRKFRVGEFEQLQLVASAASSTSTPAVAVPRSPPASPSPRARPSKRARSS
jgi:hypothetical protein